MRYSFTKRMLSLVLTLVMALSIVTVGMVSASAATLSKPTIYVRDASGSGFALWAWTAEDKMSLAGHLHHHTSASISQISRFLHTVCQIKC